jgi:hypothetical protein
LVAFIICAPYIGNFLATPFCCLLVVSATIFALDSQQLTLLLHFIPPLVAKAIYSISFCMVLAITVSSNEMSMLHQLHITHLLREQQLVSLREEHGMLGVLFDAISNS